MDGEREHQTQVEEEKQKQLQQLEEREEDESKNNDGRALGGEMNSITLDMIADYRKEVDKEETKESVFVNVGLQRWEVVRDQWLSISTTHDATTEKNHSIYKKMQRHAVELDVDEVIDCVFSNRWRQTAQTSPSGKSSGKGIHQKIDDGSFPCPVPLSQMVDILVDLWEAEGLDM
mmetsp:Transcript_28946/g.43066  ORF Transcript_28946/g.43066 Transcript_28946/m.43066 type:complete len:175 (-) Transcript_28946:433-957(-)